ncbi:MAG: nickel pincer cofactor biosynthesis protein LarC [bacterium]|nr:nickel pincer cofactor biosynthesis protein LarC [bacterium]
MKTLFFDPYAGVSGDMTLGALTDLGCPLDELRVRLSGMRIPGFDLRSERVRRGSLSGVKVHVSVEEEHHVHRKLGDVLAIVDRVEWPGAVRERIENAFTLLARAEGKVHDKPFDQIHFHEVGSFDAIVDISGSMLAVHLLGVERVVCGRVHVGEGIITGTRHGDIPNPPPAASEMLKGFELYSTGRTHEMVTPTGAAIIATLAGGSSVMPPMVLENIGYGAGDRDPKDLPSLLRVFMGASGGAIADSVVVVEANIDDMNPELYAPLLDRLFKEGALDAACVPIQMKKQRPGVLLSVIAPAALKEKMAQLILRESSSIGVRMHECERRTLNREAVEVDTPWGPVKGKVCWGHGVEKRFSPEYASCRRIHDEHGVPLAQIYQEAAIAYSRGAPEP